MKPFTPPKPWRNEPAEDYKIRHELAALNYVMKVLLSRPQEERPRIMAFLISKFGVSEGVFIWQKN